MLSGLLSGLYLVPEGLDPSPSSLILAIKNRSNVGYNILSDPKSLQASKSPEEMGTELLPVPL